MPANLPPDYHAAEESYRQAKTIEEKIACLEEMLRVMPKHKGTDKLRADLRTRIAKLRRQPKTRGATRAAVHQVRREGAGQVALAGPPHAGKSSLVAGLTHATPEVAEYPFTTHEPVPGMMPFEDIAIQLVDLPPVSEEHIEPWVFDILRGADLVWVVVEAANSLDEMRRVVALLREKRIHVVPAGSSRAGTGADGGVIRPGLLVVTGLDLPEGPEDVTILEELIEEPWPIVPVSGRDGSGFDALRRRTFEALDLVRIYTKQPGRPADREKPFTLPRGATVGDLARTIHKEVAEGLKFARLWGAGVHDGQAVQKEHVLSDGDVVEVHS